MIKKKQVFTFIFKLRSKLLNYKTGVGTKFILESKNKLKNKFFDREFFKVTFNLRNSFVYLKIISLSKDS